MSEPVQRRALKNTFAGVASFLSNAGIGLLAVPILLRAWGEERYGAWLALLAGHLLLRTLDSGYITYVGYELNLRYHSDQARLRSSLAAALPVCMLLGSLELMTWQLLDASGRLSAFLGVSQAELVRHDLSAALGVILCMGLLTGSYIGVVHRFLVPLGLMYQATWLLICFQLLQTIGLIASVLMGASVLQAALVYAGMLALSNLSSAYYVHGKAPSFFPWWRNPSLRVGAQDFTRSLLLTFNGIGQQATISGTALLVSSTFGSSTLALFATTRTLANLWASLASVFTSPLLPEIVRYHAARDGDKLVKALRAHWFFSSTLVNLAMGLFVPVASVLYSFWTRRVLELDLGLLLCLLASVASSNFSSGMITYLASVNDLPQQLVLTSARAVVFFGLALPLGASSGLRGVGMAMLASEFVVAGAAFVLVRRKLLELGVTFPRSGLLVVVAGVVPMHVLALAHGLLGGLGTASKSAEIATLIVITWLNWRTLDPEIKLRALHAVRIRA